jgi:uncharacterized protein (DUF1499 family)
MPLRALSLTVALLAVLLLLASGPGVRLGLWPYQTGFLLMRVAVFVGGAAALLGVAGLFIPQARSALVVAGLLLGLAAAAFPLYQLQRARSFPPINDISTAGDTAPATLAQQQLAYPDLQPLALPLPPPQTFAKALAAARASGWQIVSADPGSGRIQAVATTFWFGFKDDVTVRVAPQGAGSRIDVRSRSRAGRGDAGANAARIRSYLKKLRA